jgi:PTS system galactitol-specific IIA component
MDKKVPGIEFTIDEKLILVNEAISNKEEIITKLGELLFQNGFVKDTFTKAVLDREIVYPTGLKARVTGVAVPHTDTIHVLKPAVAIATLKEPVVFHGMGAPDTDVEVSIVLMLAIHDPKEVVNVLRKIIFVIEDDEALRNILAADEKVEIKSILKAHIDALTAKLGK